MEKSRRNRWVFELGIKILAFVLVPFLIAVGLTAIVESDTLKELEDQQKIEMERLLSRMRVMSDPRERFLSLLNAISRLPYGSADFVEASRNLSRRNRDVVELYLFDKDGEVQPIEVGERVPRFAANHFISVVLGKAARPRPSILNTFGGSPESAELIRAGQGRLVELNSNVKTWGGLWRLHDPDGNEAGFLLAFVIRRNIDPEELLDTAAASLHLAYGRHFTVGWMDSVAPYADAFPRPVNADFCPSLSEKVKNLGTGESFFRIGRRIGLARYSDDGRLLFCLSKRPPDLPLMFSWIRLAILLASLFGAVGVLVVSGEYFQIVFGLGKKLVFLLVICGLTPVTALLVTGFIDRGNREKTFIDDIKRSQIDALTRFDEEIFHDYSSVTQVYRDFVNGLKYLPDDKLQSALEEFSPLNELGGSPLERVIVVDKDGNRLLYSQRKLEHGQDRGLPPEVLRLNVHQLLLGAMGTIYMESPDEEGPLGRESMVANAAKNAAKTIYREMFLKPFNIQPANLAGWNTLASVAVINDAESLPRAVFMAFHDRRIFQLQYLDRLFRTRGVPKENEPRLIAFPVVKSRDWRPFPNAATQEHPALERLRDQAAASRLPSHEVIGIRDRDYLVSALLGSHVDGYVLMLAQPLDPIYRMSASLNRRLALLSLLMVLQVWALAWMASTLLLRPVEELRQGLGAIEGRNFRTKIAVGRVSELGDIASRLNTVLDGLAELEVAKSVQETLWPEEPMVGAGWKVSGACITATDLGGDHHDWFVSESCPDRVFLAVGDVAGHGIASSLIEAAVKMSLAVHSMGLFSPAEILSRINLDLICQNLRKLPMTLWLGVYDAPSRLLTYASAGHCYPILIGPSAGEAPLFLKSTGLPLGLRKKGMYTEHQLSLLPGDTLFAYSDGLVEAKNPDSELFGFDRLSVLFNEHSSDDQEGVPETIFSKLAAWSDSETPEDDQTILILKIHELDGKEASS